MVESSKVLLENIWYRDTKDGYLESGVRLTFLLTKKSLDIKMQTADLLESD